MAAGFKSGGRRKGTPNKKTQEQNKMISELLVKCEGDVFPGDAHAFLVAIYKNPNAPLDLRVSAAKIAIRYETASLSSISLETNVNLETRAQRIIAGRKAIMERNELVLVN